METKINYLKEMEGTEVWTNALAGRFNESVCVGIIDGLCWNNGKSFKPTKKEIKGIWDDMIYTKFGSQEQIKKDMEAEFGHLKRDTEEETLKAIEEAYPTN